MFEATGTMKAIAAATARDRSLIAAREERGTDAPGDQLAALLDLARAFDEVSISHALIGGIAVGIRSGAPRATADINVCVPTTVERTAVTDALARAGFEHRGSHEHSVNFRHASGEPVQIAFDAMFDEMIARAGTVEIAGATVRVVGRDDLIAMKERAARDPARRKSKALRDAADVELLRGDVAPEDEGW